MPAGKTENIKQVRLSQLFPFERHPFKVNNDAEMLKIVESVKQYGVLSPAIARPLPGGGYELVSGHRRKRACELAGLETMPVIVREAGRRRGGDSRRGQQFAARRTASERESVCVQAQA